MLNNTGLILTDITGENGLKNFKYITDSSHNIKQLIKLLPDENPDEIRVWCLHGVCIEEKVYLFFIKVKMIEEGIMPVNFELLGSGIAVGTKGEWKFNRIIYNNSDLLWKENQPKFAAAVLKDNKDDFIYLYGVIQESFIQNCYLARIKKEYIEDITGYDYYCGNERWDKNINNSIPVFSRMPNELSVSWNEYLKCYLAVHSFDLSGNIVARTSDTPWGPWSEPEVLYHIEVIRKLKLPYPILIYAGKEHPSLSRENGKILYLTYIEFEEYYPHLVEIELE